MSETVVASTGASNWWVRNAMSLKSVFRILFGVIWLIDGALKFQPGFVDQFSVSGDGQPAWLGGWFSLWAGPVNGNAAFWVYLTGSLELALGVALVAGLARKLAYLGGTALSLLIWAVPEGFGGPYGPSSTDIGTGATYAVLFLALIVLNASYGPSRWSLDAAIERRFPSWARLAEFTGRPPRTARPEGAGGAGLPTAGPRA